MVSKFGEICGGCCQHMAATSAVRGASRTTVTMRTVKGFEVQRLGHTITAIFDPSTDTETGFLSCFVEPQEAAEYMTYKRTRR